MFAKITVHSHCRIYYSGFDIGNSVIIDNKSTDYGSRTIKGEKEVKGSCGALSNSIKSQL